MSQVATIDASDRPAAPLNACLTPLLQLLRWRGTPRQLVEATGAQPPATLLEFRNTLARLGFTSSMQRTRLGRLDPRLLPCLFVTGEGPLVVASPGERPGTFRCFDGATGLPREIDSLRQTGTACFFQTASLHNGAQAERGWVRGLLARFELGLFCLLGLTLLLNVLALVPAFFVQSVYDQVLPTRSTTALAFLAGGAVFALLCDALLRMVRGAAMARFGARLDFLIGTAVFEKMLSLPYGQLEAVGVGTRVAQMRELETLRAAFAGPLALAVLDMPFGILFVAAIAVLGGWLALLPLIVAGIMIACGLMLIRYARHALQRQRQHSGDLQALLVEMLSQMPAIKASGTHLIWLERFRERSAQAAFATLKQARIAALCDTVAYGINIVAGGATLIIGAFATMDGTLSIGGLIASMTLVWRLLGPLQTLFLAMTRIDQIQAAARRVDLTMSQPGEAGGSGKGGRRSGTTRFTGRITFDRVFLRYDNHHEAALAGVSFDIRPGEIVAITGGNGSGKSSILKLIAALYQPQAGHVLIDGGDIRQLGHDELRQRVVYLPQSSDLFTGTIRDSLRLASPVAPDDDLWDALMKVGLWGEVDAMPDRLDTMIGPQLSAQFARKLVLARTLLIDANIVLLDEPGPLLNEDGEDLLLEQLYSLRGRVTVLLATHHPDHVSVADRAIVLRNGVIVHDGTPQNLMNRLQEAGR